MRKRLLSWLLVFCMLAAVFPVTVLSVDTQTNVAATTDSDEPEEKKEYTVTFNAGGKITKVTVTAGETVAKPKNPKRGGLFNDFTGWATSADGTAMFDFDAPITGDVTLYAYWGGVNTSEVSRWQMMMEESKRLEEEKNETIPQGETVKVRFVDSETKQPILLSDIFTIDATFGIGRWTNHYVTPDQYSEALPDLKVSVFDNANPNDTEFVFQNVPELVLTEVDGIMTYGNYELFFDYNEVLYEHPGEVNHPYFIDSTHITQNDLGEYSVTIELDDLYLKVKGVLVTHDNAMDVLGNGKVQYNYNTKTLTLTDSYITATVKESVIETNIHNLILHIPEETTSTLTAIDAYTIRANGLCITGKGTLRMGCYPYYYDSIYVGNDYLYVEKTTIIFNDTSSGISCGDLVISEANISNSGIYDDYRFISATSIDITNSIIDITTNGSNIIWSHGGDININGSDITLYCVAEEMNYSYLLFAETASIFVDNMSIITLAMPNVTDDKDHGLLCATDSIVLEEGLTIRDDNGKVCEIYRTSWEYGGKIYYGNYSIKCTDGTYPKKIFIAKAGSYYITGNFVYTNHDYGQSPVEYTKCMLRDAATNEVVGYGEINNGELLLFGRHPAGTYILEGDGISETGNIKYEINETIVVTGDTNLGTVQCKSYIPWYCKMYLNFVDSQTKEVLKLDEIFGLNFVFKLSLYHNDSYVSSQIESIADEEKTVVYYPFHYYSDGQYTFYLTADDDGVVYDLNISNKTLSRNSSDSFDTIQLKDGVAYVTIGLDPKVID